MELNCEKEIIIGERIGESYYKIKHPSGLTIYVMELKGFSGSCAMFGTKYGSVNTCFKISADRDFVTVPEGIAHFLEHKLFENEDCQVFELYAKTGANANAYTSFDRTVYHFDCTENFRESLEILLDFVQKPYFTSESVAKEQGIIGQEIKMCEDNPYRRVYFELLKAVYEKHPVRIEIAGTVESIADIDADLLYRCYNTFYNLNNMVLVCAGNCTVDEVMDVADRMLMPCEDKGLESVFPDEPDGVAKRETAMQMSVGVPLFAIGYKSKPCSGREMLRREFASSYLMSAIFGQTSKFYKESTESGLINQSFETETDDGDGFFMNAATGESPEPRKVLEQMNAELRRVRSEGLLREEFEEFRKSRYGQLVGAFNNVPATASQLLSAHLAGVGGFEASEVLAEMTYEDAMALLDELLDPENCAISIIEPIHD